MPDMPADLRSYTAVTKARQSLTTVFASSEVEARAQVTSQLRRLENASRFDAYCAWVRDGCLLADNGPLQVY